MSDEHVLQVRLSGVRIVPDEDDDHHSENIRRIRSQEAEPEEDPHPPRWSLVLCEDKGREGRREDSKGIDPGTRGRDDNRHLDRQVPWPERQPRGRGPWDL